MKVKNYLAKKATSFAHNEDDKNVNKMKFHLDINTLKSTISVGRCTYHHLNSLSIWSPFEENEPLHNNKNRYHPMKKWHQAG